MKNHKFDAAEQGMMIAVRHHKWMQKVIARGDSPATLEQMPDYYFGQLQETGIGTRCSMAKVRAAAMREFRMMY